MIPSTNHHHTRRATSRSRGHYSLAGSFFELLSPFALAATISSEMAARSWCRLPDSGGFPNETALRCRERRLLAGLLTAAVRSVGVAAAIWCAGSAEVVAADPPDAPVAAFLLQHCQQCHGETKPKSRPRLDRMEADFTQPDMVEQWLSIQNRLQAGEMPPEDQPRPDAEQVAAVIEWIDARLVEVAARRKAEGRTVLRRLNRVEYQNTVPTSWVWMSMSRTCCQKIRWLSVSTT